MERETGNRKKEGCKLHPAKKREREGEKRGCGWCRIRSDKAPVLDPSSLESILVKSVSIEARSAESLVLSKLPWLTLSRSLASVYKRTHRRLRRQTQLNQQQQEPYITHFTLTINNTINYWIEAGGYPLLRSLNPNI